MCAYVNVFLFNLSGVPTWHGPQSKLHSKCKIVGKATGGVDICKKECLLKGCNNFDKTGGQCTLRKCSLPMSLPDDEPNNANTEGYVFEGNILSLNEIVSS